MGSLQKLAAAKIAGELEAGNEDVRAKLAAACEAMKELVDQAKAAKAIKNPAQGNAAELLALVLPLARLMANRVEKWKELLTTLVEREKTKRTHPLSADELEDLTRTEDKVKRAVAKYAAFKPLAEDMRRQSALVQDAALRAKAVFLDDKAGSMMQAVRLVQLQLRALRK